MKPQFGYYTSQSGTAPARGAIGALDGATPAEVQRVAVGLAFLVGEWTVVTVKDDAADLLVATRYPNRGGAALRETREDERRDLNTAIRDAIRAAGYKPVRL